jgi:hypothetical protein
MRRSAASLPLARVTATVETGDHAHGLGDDPKEQRLRKTAATGSVDILVDNGELLWLCAYALNDGLNFCNETIGQLHIRAACQWRASSSSARTAGLKTTDGTLSAAVGDRP